MDEMDAMDKYGEFMGRKTALDASELTTRRSARLDKWEGNRTLPLRTNVKLILKRHTALLKRMRN